MEATFLVMVLICVLIPSLSLWEFCLRLIGGWLRYGWWCYYCGVSVWRLCFSWSICLVIGTNGLWNCLLWCIWNRVMRFDVIVDKKGNDEIWVYK